MSNQNLIPIFYACDDKFIRYTMVSIRSMIENASKDYQYHVHILSTGLSKNFSDKLKSMENENFQIFFDDVTENLCSIQDQLPVRDYYSATTYFRIFMAEMFPQYDKAIYIDSDTIVEQDISALFSMDLGENYVAAAPCQLVGNHPVFRQYSEDVIGIPYKEYFNAGVLLINCAKFRQESVSVKILDLINRYTFQVALDQDYLNVVCRDKVLWLDTGWNTETYLDTPKSDDIKILHYNHVTKPWHYPDAPYADRFWVYAKLSPCHEEIQKICEEYTQEEREADKNYEATLIHLADMEIHNEYNYHNIALRSADLNQDRRDVVKKISLYELSGRFDEDVEEDPPSKPLHPEDIDYLADDLKYRTYAKICHVSGQHFLDKLMRNKQFVIKEIRGLEHLKNLDSGAIITCNHFNAMDSFAIQMAYEAAAKGKRKFYRVIREGNYTSFKGFFGFLMRHFYTLPLSSDARTMRKFVVAVNTLLQQGHYILFYPEQSMWWNYRKPKPLKNGAYTFAAKNHVPVLPCFITMESSKVVDDTGFYVQEYTIHIGEPIYPDKGKTNFQNMEDLRNKNFVMWKKVYEDFYKKPLKYTCDPKKLKGVPME